MGGFLLLPEDELVLVAHLLDGEGLKLLASIDLGDGPCTVDGLTDPLPLPAPRQPNIEPSEPLELTFWAHQLGSLRPWSDAPAPTSVSERVHRMVNQQSVADFGSAVDEERSPVLRWRRTNWHSSGALCPGLLQAQARPAKQQPQELMKLHARVTRWMKREGHQLDPFEHAPEALPVDPPRNTKPFRVWAHRHAAEWVRCGGRVWPWNA